MTAGSRQWQTDVRRTLVRLWATTIVCVLCCSDLAVAGVIDGVGQVVLVVANGWDDLHATLQCFERRGTAWRAVGAATPCVVGKKGLAWGRGVAPATTRDLLPASASLRTSFKREGDLRSPAGVFAISGVFGFTPPFEARTFVHMPYTQITSRLECVDDARSPHYNRVLDGKHVRRDWKSAEHMRRVKAYAWGAFIDHNVESPVAGAGSCIFFHIWDGPHHGTAGCTALEEEALKRVLGFLRPEARPVLVQLPREEYGPLREVWKLP